MRSPTDEIQFTPARVIMQDFTGVPCVVDLATMREAMKDLGGDPAKINPLAPAELVIDHSVIADLFGTARRTRAQRRARVRAQPRALPVPALGPDRVRRLQGRAAGHRHRAPGQHRGPRPRRDGPERAGVPRHLRRHRLAHHDGQRPRRARLGRRRHRGRGGHARPARVDAHPARRRLQAHRALPEGAPPPTSCSRSPRCCASTAWSASSSSSTARASASVPLANRATIGNMSPEYGSTVAIFPIDDETLRYLRLTGRSAEQVALVEAYTKAQGLWHDPANEPVYSEYLELDLGTVVPSLAGPKRPQDRVILTEAKAAVRSSRRCRLHAATPTDPRAAPRRSRSTARAPSHDRTTARSRSPPSPRAPTPPTRR